MTWDVEEEFEQTAQGRARPGEEASQPDANVVVQELLKLSAIEYDQRREAEAKRLGIRVSTLDESVKAARCANETAETSILFPTVTPCAGPVDGAGLLRELTLTVKRFCVVPDYAAESVALWLLFSWTLDAWTIAPMINITAAERACGKTRLLEVLGCLVPKPLPTGSISAAALFRVTEAHQPTLLIDEVDTFVADRPELVGILNNGYVRAQAFVIRCDGDDHDVRSFCVWGPKVLCGIGELPDTTSSRCITIAMRRRRSDEKVERLRADRRDWVDGLQSRCARWAADNVARLRSCDPDMPNRLDDRAQDNWRPLIAIADRAGGVWPNLARLASVAMSAPRLAQEESIGIQLLRDIRAVFEDSGGSTLQPTLLAAELEQMTDSPWRSWNRGNPITPNRIAKFLAAYEIASRRTRDGRYYDRSDFTDAWTRYCTEPP